MRYRMWMWMLVGLLGVTTPIGAFADEADEAYERAREALDDREYREAAQRFGELRDDFPESELMASAVYWEAFARYRLGTGRNLRLAAELLEMHADRYRSHSTHEEAERLYTRVMGLLAERGEVDAAREVHERAEGDLDAETRMAALNAILQMDSDRALPLLKKVLAKKDRDNAELRAKAMFLLGQHYDDEAAELLMDAVRNDPDPEVRGQAMFWLGQSAGDDALPLIQEILADPTLDAVYEQAVFALSQNDSDEASRMLRDLALDEDLDEETRGQAVFWLGQRRDSYGFLADLYETLEDEELKGQVIFGMSQQSGRKQMEWLKARFYDEDEDTEIRKTALFWLAQNDEFGLEELIGLYDDVDHREMKEQVIFALSQHGGSRGVRELIRIAREESDVELRKNAIFWIGQSGEDEALDYLEELIDQ